MQLEDELARLRGHLKSLKLQKRRRMKACVRHSWTDFNISESIKKVESEITTIRNRINATGDTNS
jgi:hypothetical protein